MNQQKPLVESYDLLTGETIASYLTSVAAAQQSGVTAGAICHVLHGRQHSAGGVGWRIAGAEITPPSLTYDGTRYGVETPDGIAHLSAALTLHYLCALHLSRTTAQNCMRDARETYTLALVARAAQTPRTSLSPLDAFLKEQAHFVAGEKMPFGEFYEKFQMYLPDNERYLWTKHKVSQSLPVNHPSGAGTNNKKFVANLSWEQKEPDAGAKMLIVKDGKLVKAA